MSLELPWAICKNYYFPATNTVRLTYMGVKPRISMNLLNMTVTSSRHIVEHIYNLNGSNYSRSLNNRPQGKKNSRKNVLLQSYRINYHFIVVILGKRQQNYVRNSEVTWDVINLRSSWSRQLKSFWETDSIWLNQALADSYQKGKIESFLEKRDQGTHVLLHKQTLLEI